MRQFLNSVATISALSAIALFGSINAATAQEATPGLGGSYVGVGGGTSGDLGVVTVNGRVNFSNSQFSIRPSVLYNPDSGNTAVIGTATYDLPVANNANVYVGAGGAFEEDFSSFVLQGGVEGAIAKNVVLFGDVTYITETGSFPWKAGVGYRF
jgi:hypothetical protein